MRLPLSDLKVAAILIQGLGLRPVIFIGLVLEYFHHGF